MQNIFWEQHHLMLFLLANSYNDQQFCSCKDARPCNFATVPPSVHKSRTRHQISDTVLLYEYMNQCKTGQRVATHMAVLCACIVA